MGSTHTAIALAVLSVLMVVPAPAMAQSGQQYVDDTGYLLLPNTVCERGICPVRDTDDAMGANGLELLSEKNHLNRASYRFPVPVTQDEELTVQVHLDLTSHTELDEVRVRLCFIDSLGFHCHVGIDETVSDDKTWEVSMVGGPQSEWLFILELTQGADVHYIAKITEV